MTPPDRKRPIGVEELLRLKRAERPSPEFWPEFERELRAKQLAALVEKRPWWRSLPAAVRGFSWYQVPLGAAAVLALTLFSLRSHQSAPGLARSGDSGVTDAVASAVADFRSHAAPDSATTVRASVAADNAVATAAAEPLRSDATPPSELARMVPMLSTGTNTPAEERPSARSIAENLAAAEVILGTTAPTFESRVVPVRQAPREPLTEITTASESHRSRFAAAFAAMTADGSVAPSARVARRLSDEQLYDSIHRFGASGNSVSFKF